MKHSIPRSPFATPLSRSGKETELRIRSIFQWKKQRPPLWLMALVALVILTCCGLVSCQPKEAATPAPFTMELQYYDELGNYIEVPALIPPEGQEDNLEIQAMNDELAYLLQEYSRQTADPIARMAPGTKCLFYPTETARYFNLLLYRQEEHTDYPYLTLTSWVYDREDNRRLTLGEALTLSGTDLNTVEDGLRQKLEAAGVPAYADRTPEDNYLQEVTLAAFRMVSDTEGEFYLYVKDAYGNNLLYVYDSKGYRPYPYPEKGVLFAPLISADQTISTDPPLWVEWQEQGQPKDGFTAPPVTEEARNTMLAQHALSEDFSYFVGQVALPTLLSHTIGDRTLTLVDVAGMPHVAGLENLILGQWDEKAQEYVGPVYALRGDCPVYSYWTEGEALFLLCANSTIYQGWESGSPPQLFRFDDQGLTRLTELPEAAASYTHLLPEGGSLLADGDYWPDHKALPAPGGVELFARNPRWSNIAPTYETQWEYLGYLPLSWDSVPFAPAVEGLRAYLAGLHHEEPAFSDLIILDCTLLGDARGSAENWRLATAPSLTDTSDENVEWYQVTVDRNTGEALEVRTAQQTDASVPWEELDSPANLARRDQLILDWLNDDPDDLHHYLPGTVPEQPVEDNTVRIDEIRYLGEAVTYETTGVAYRVTRSVWQNRRESADDPGTLGWYELYPVAVVLGRSGYTGELEDVRGDALYEEGMDVTDLIHQITYRLNHAQVALYREGYPAPVGPGSQITFHNEPYDGPMEVEEIEGWDLYGWPGAYWAWHRWEGFAARCYHPSPEEGRDPAIQYIIDHVETTRTDLFTPRGIRVGSTRAEVREAYPNILTGDYWGLYPEETDMLIYLPFSGHDPAEVTDMSQLEFYQGLGTAMLFLFDGDRVRQIVLTTMNN